MKIQTGTSCRWGDIDNLLLDLLVSSWITMLSVRPSSGLDFLFFLEVRASSGARPYRCNISALVFLGPSLKCCAPSTISTGHLLDHLSECLCFFKAKCQTNKLVFQQHRCFQEANSCAVSLGSQCCGRYLTGVSTETMCPAKFEMENKMGKSW